MSENEFYVVKEYKFDNPLITKIDSIIDSCFRGCHKKYFHNFTNDCIYNFELTNIVNNEIINLTICEKNMNLYGLKKKLKVSRKNGFIFNQINKQTIKFYSHLRYINIGYYLNCYKPMCHRRFSRKISQTRKFINKFYNDVENLFQFECQK